jgi:hypothetical protein
VKLPLPACMLTDRAHSWAASQIGSQWRDARKG